MGPDHVELAAIVQVFGAQPGVCIEVWPAAPSGVGDEDAQPVTNRGQCNVKRRHQGGRIDARVR